MRNALRHDTHAMDTTHLYIALNRMGLAPWMPVITTLIHHWHGLERYIPPDEASPLTQLAAVIDDAQKCEPRLRNLLLKRRLARLPVFNYRATDAKGNWWNPLRQAFIDFAHEGTPHVWCDWEPWPSPTIIEQWLQQQLPQEWRK